MMVNTISLIGIANIVRIVGQRWTKRRPTRSNLISKATVKRWLNSIGVYGYEGKVDALPTIEAEPVVHSKWINVQDTSGHYYKKCRKCGTYIEAVFFANDYDVNYCPCCGAKMDGLIEDE